MLLVTLAMMGAAWFGLAAAAGGFVCPEVDVYSDTETMQWSLVPLGPACAGAADQPRIALMANEMNVYTGLTIGSDVTIALAAALLANRRRVHPERGG